MKRREFLVYSATSAGVLVPVLARAIEPCPPATVSVDGGTSVSTGCISNANATAEWRARATASGVLYATNFTDVYVNRASQAARAIIDSSTLRAESDRQADVQGDPNAVVFDSSRKISGSGSLRLDTLDTATTQSGSWAMWANGTDQTVYRRLYVQFMVYYPKQTLGWRYITTTDQGLKILNCGQYGGGQLVVYMNRWLPFPTAFINGAPLVADAVGHTFGSSNNPWGRTVLRLQDAIDAGGALSTKNDYLLRYGPLARGLDQDMNLAYDGSTYLYDRAQPAGYPDTRAATHGIPLQMDGWTVIQTFLEYNESNPAASSMQMWASAYGQAPTLIMNNVGNLPFSANTTNSWKRFELLNYDTGRKAEVGVRPTLRTYYDEIVISKNPIAWPVTGGTPPSNQG